jgi:hypothetical protein
MLISTDQYSWLASNMISHEPHLRLDISVELLYIYKRSERKRTLRDEPCIDMQQLDSQ